MSLQVTLTNDLGTSCPANIDFIGNFGPMGPQGPVGPPGPATPVGGAETQVLFHEAGAAMGDPGFTYAKATDTLTLGNASDAALRFVSASGQAFHAPTTALLDLRNGVTGQALRAFNTYTDASNSERALIGFSGNTVCVAAQASGTGTLRGLRLDAASIALQTSATTRWSVMPTGELMPAISDTYDIGATSLRVKKLFVRDMDLGGALVVTGTTSLKDPTIAGASSVPINTAAGGIWFTGPAIRHANLAFLPNEREFLFQGGANATAVVDTYGINLSLRGTAVGGALRIYNVSGYTDLSNFERAIFKWTTNVLQLGTEALGTGTRRNLQLLTGTTLTVQDATNVNQYVLAMTPSSGYIDLFKTNDGAGNTESLRMGSTGTNYVVQSNAAGTGVSQPISIFTAGSAHIYLATNSVTRWFVDGANGHLLPYGTDNIYDIGTAGIRIRTLYAGTDVRAASGMTAGYTSGTPAVGDIVSYSGITPKSKLSQAGLQLGTDVSVGWSSTVNAGNNATVLWSDGTGLLNQRNGVTAQRFTVYNTYTDSSNYERAVMGYASGELLLGHEALGTGTLTRVMGLRASLIQFRNPNATNLPGATLDLTNKRWDFYNLYIAAADYERFATYWSGNALFMETQAATSGVARNIRLRAGTAALLYLGSGAADRWQLDATGHMVPMTTDTYNIGQTTLRVSNVYSVTENINGAMLTADATNILAQRNGTSAQIFRQYFTYTDASNYERTEMTSATAFTIKVTAAGTGAFRTMALDAVRLTIATGTGGTTSVRWRFAEDGHFRPETDNTNDIGIAGAYPRNIRAGTGVIAPMVRSTTLTFATLPAASSNEGARCFISDGSLPMAANYGAAAAGGGANKVPVVSNGTAWVIG